jgi:hypothetical protein
VTSSKLFGVSKQRLKFQELGITICDTKLLSFLGTEALRSQFATLKSSWHWFSLMEAHKGLYEVLAKYQELNQTL